MFGYIVDRLPRGRRVVGFTPVDRAANGERAVEFGTPLRA